jgi:phage-related baseplate assembly protein
MSGNISVNSLPTPQFVNDADGLNPLLILADMISSFELAANRTLYPAQLEMLLINLYAYRETLIRNVIQNAALQNLLAFASYPVLDYLGELVATSRLQSQAAGTTLQFVLVNTLTTSYTIASNTQVGSYDGSQIFLTATPLTIPVGIVSGTVAATAQTSGTAANGYLPGQINVLLGGNALIASVTNTTTTGGGSAPEEDDHYRTRIQAAPNQYSVAGPSGAYRYFALSADPSIIDVSVVTVTPGTVNIYVLTGPITAQPTAAPNNSGIASNAILEEVNSICSSATVRPLTDTVVVSAVTEVDYTVVANITLYANAQQNTVELGVQEAALALMTDITSQIQQDLVPSQWIAAMSVFGVYDVDIAITAQISGVPLIPTADGSFILGNGQWTNCTVFSPNYIIGTRNLP